MKEEFFCGTGIGMMLAANKVKGAYASKSRDYDSGIFGFCLYMQRTFGKKSGTYLRIRETSFSLKTKTEIKTVITIVFISVLKFQITY